MQKKKIQIGLKICLAIFYLLPGIHKAEADVVWYPKTMKVEHVRNKFHGNHITITQDLPEGTTGWKMSRFQLPESWEISAADPQSDKLVLTLANGECYYITPANFGPLSFALLDGGKKSNGEILAIWNKYAAYACHGK